MRTIYFCITILYVLLIFSFSSNAQTKNNEIIQGDYIVYLKNGTIINCISLEQTSSGIKIQSRDGKIKVYRINEIKEIIKDEPKDNLNQKNLNEVKSKFDYFNDTKITFGIPLGETEGSVYGFETIHGYYKDKIFAGVGVGINVDKYITSIPFFLNFRYDFLKNDFNPYLSASIGKAMVRSEDLKGGIFTEFSVGSKYDIFESMILKLNIAYRTQEFIDRYDDTWVWVDSFLVFKIGVTF